MNQADLFNFITAEHQVQLDIIRAKNGDYANNQDPFANFRMFGEMGFLVRMGDKLSRLKQILSSGKTNVSDESVEDTLRDLANYANLLLAYRKEV